MGEKVVLVQVDAPFQVLHLAGADMTVPTLLLDVDQLKTEGFPPAPDLEPLPEGAMGLPLVTDN